MNKGEPVFHIYLIFILCCFAYGAYSLHNYIVYLEDTIKLQSEAIEKQNQENQILKIQLESTIRYYNQPRMSFSRPILFKSEL